MSEFDQLPSEQQAAFRDTLSSQLQAWKETFRTVLPESHKDSLKICSFSGTQSSIIMWSHYANQHRGFCIEYDTDCLPQENLFIRMLYPVIYSQQLFDGTNYYLAAIQDQKSFNILFPALAALHKSPEWSYEDEWRLVIPAGMVKSEGPWHVPTPKRVYLGSRMSDNDKARVIEICEKKKIEVHQMQLAQQSFSLISTLTVAYKPL